MALAGPFYKKKWSGWTGST